MENLERQGAAFFITGASRESRSACALALAKMGARIALAARNETELEAVAAEIAAGGGAGGIPGSGRAWDGASISTTAKTAIFHIGGVDILVNNTGSPGTPCCCG